MKKPEKKKIPCYETLIRKTKGSFAKSEKILAEIKSYSQAWDKWEKYHKQEIQEALMEGVESGKAEILDRLPSEEEIHEKFTNNARMVCDKKGDYWIITKQEWNKLAKAISKRIKNDKIT